jgi:DNA mismatch repair protein MutS
MPPTKLTPAMEQYWRFKRQYHDAILFFRMGDFYEMFFDDAKEAAQLLGLTLTSRNHGKTAGEVPLAGVPHHAMEGYLAKLIQRGRKVAICEQIEDPKQAKGVVKRDVVQVVSPGTALADSMLDQQRNNFLLALCRQDDKIGLASVDLSTGDFTLNELPAHRLEDELTSLTPAELLIAEEEEESWIAQLKRILPNVALSRADDWQFERDGAYELLLEQLKVQSLKGFGCEDMDVAIRAGGAAISYLRDNQRGAVEHINRVTRRHSDDFALIDAAAQRNLELLANQQDGGKTNSLLEILDQSRTPMGARLLRRWVVSPLKEPAAIDQRLDAVQELVERRDIRRNLREQLRQVGDLERLMARICCQRANGRDLVGLARSLTVLPQLRTLLADAQCDLLQRLIQQELPEVGDLVDQIRTALVDEPPAVLTEGGLIRDGYNPEVDELRQISTGGKDFIVQLQIRERERTGINSLKVGYNQVFGYYIEISKANLDKAPEDYIRKQTLTNAERYITPELKEYEAKILGAEEKLQALENRLFLELRTQVARWAVQVQQAARSLARIDLLASLAEVAESEDYVRPQIDAGTGISIQSGRHPVVEGQLREGRFVPNDVTIDTTGHQILLITGPNMAGKSTIIRQVGLIVLMAQMGGFVPARAARIGVVDRIFTRVGASDNLARGESTFMVEMNEAANILNNVTDRSLILIDELGRGTSTFDGLSIAWAIVEYLHKQQEAHPRTLFATHYHEMTELADVLDRVENFNVQVREEGDHVVFLHRLGPGPADRSYGINVAQMAGMPAQVIDRAKEILHRLEQEQIDTDQIHAADGNGQSQYPIKEERMIVEPAGEVEPKTPEIVEEETPEPKPQLELFPTTPGPGAELAKELSAMELSQVTPLEALLKLHEWKEKLKEN